MYHEHFGLKEPPFELCTDPRFLYLSPAHSRARAYLDYAVYRGDGLVIISGDIGVGKSTLIHDITERENTRADVIAIRQPQSDTVGFMQAFLLHCNHSNPPSSRAELIATVQQELAQRFMWGRRTTLIVDEAQKLSQDVLEELRMLADRQIGIGKPLAIVLVGQPCLREQLSGHHMEQFRQRVRLSYHLSGLDVHESAAYIQRRLTVAGAHPGPHRIVKDSAVVRMHRFTGGIPRLINVITDLSLTAAYIDGEQTVSTAQVNAALDELGWVPYRTRMRTAQLAVPGAGLRARVKSQWLDTAEVTRDVAQRVVHTVRAKGSEWYCRAVPLGRRLRAWLRTRAGDDLIRGVRQLRQGTRQRWTGLRLALEAHLRTRGFSELQASDAMGGAVRGTLFFVLGTLLASLAITAALRPDLTATSAQRSDRAPGNIEATAVVDAGMRANGRTDFLLFEQPANKPEASAAVRDVALVQADIDYITALAAALAAPADGWAAAAPKLQGLLDANWLLAQTPDTYVIQILAARKADVVERFLEDKTANLDIAYYRKLRGDEHWYVLVAGVYPDYASAKQASLDMPAAVRKTQPWIRPLAKVQADIRDTNRHLAPLASL